MAVFDQADARVLLEHQYLSSICRLRRERFAQYSRAAARLRIRRTQTASLQVLSSSTCDEASERLRRAQLMEVWKMIGNAPKPVNKVVGEAEFQRSPADVGGQGPSQVGRLSWREQTKRGPNLFQ